MVPTASFLGVRATPVLRVVLPSLIPLLTHKFLALVLPLPTSTLAPKRHFQLNLTPFLPCLTPLWLPMAIGGIRVP